MNKFKLYFILLFISAGLFSCKKDDIVPITPPRDFAVQYLADNAAIEEYLKTNYMTLTTVNGEPDITITKIPTGGTQTSIWNNTQIPLQSKIVKNDTRATNLVSGTNIDIVDYKLYYLILNQGGGSNPTSIDSTFTSYKGWNLENVEFDSNSVPFWSTYPALSINEVSLISGYRQVLSELKTATGSTTAADGTISFTNSGVGVVFIPSGLGYFNNARPLIPAYSPIAFRIRLHTLKERDHDRDGVKTKNENLNNDGDVFNDDTDNDTIPNFLDTDDDGDGTLTKNEIRINGALPGSYASILDCSGTTNGTKKHLDKNCK